MKGSGQIQRKIRFGIAMDEPLSCAGLHDLIREHDRFRVVWLPASIERLVQALRLSPVDLVLADMACGFPADVAGQLRESGVTSPIIVWMRIPAGQSAKPPVAAQSVVLDKRVASGTLMACVATLLAGRDWNGDQAAEPQMSSSFPSPPIHVTPRESELMNLVADGYNNRQIAEQMLLTEGSVKVSLSRLFDKLGIQDRLGLALYSMRLPFEVGVNRRPPKVRSDNAH